MNDCNDDCQLANICSQRHWSIYWLIIVGSLAVVCGRIWTLGIPTGPQEKTPFFSANDRSRWVTIRALGDQGRYEIDDIINDNRSGVRWDTIDKVYHVGPDDQPHFYSSKPPLFPTLIAGIYRAGKLAFGWSLANEPLNTARWIVLLINGLPWLLYLYLLASTLERLPVRDWTRYFILAAAGMGTFLSTFAVTINNHLPAAICAMAWLYFHVHGRKHQPPPRWMFVLTGLITAFAAANELPATSLLAVAAVFAAYRSARRFVGYFLPAAMLVAGGFFATNYIAHNDWRPPYAHRGDGATVATFEGDFDDELNRGEIPDSLAKALQPHSLLAPKIAPAAWPFKDDQHLQRWTIQDLGQYKFTLLRTENTDQYQLCEWDNWYVYEGSYWISDKKSPIDRGEQDTAVYLFHVFFGHHGIFSLTPIWLLSLAGLIGLLVHARYGMRELAAVTIALSILVIAFYVAWVPDHDRNYGGKTSAFRWAFWLAPLWLLGMIPVVDWLGQSRWGRALCLLLLLISALSAFYSSGNPWVHPWLYAIWDQTGLPK